MTPTAWWQGRQKHLERPSSPRREIDGSWAGRTSGDAVKSVDRESDLQGRAVAVKRGNARCRRRLLWVVILTPGRQRRDEKDTDRFVGPENEAKHQGEDRIVPAIVGPVPPRLHDRDVLVTACARLCMHRKRFSISHVLVGQILGIKEVEEGIWIVRCMPYDLGFIDREQMTLQPLDNPFGPRLSPMSSVPSVADVSGPYRFFWSGRRESNPRHELGKLG